MQQRIRCSGKLHTIVLTDKGRLRLLGHTKEEMQAEEAVHKLGGEVCPCARILFAWRAKCQESNAEKRRRIGKRRYYRNSRSYHAVVSPDFKKVLRKAVDVESLRGGRSSCVDDKEAVRLWLRESARERAEAIFRASYCRCGFRHMYDHRLDVRLAESPVWGWKPESWAYRRQNAGAVHRPLREGYYGTVTGSAHYFVIPWQWHLKCRCIGDEGIIYRRKRARLVLDVNGSKLLVAKQGRKYNLVTEWIEAKEGECPPSKQ